MSEENEDMSLFSRDKRYLPGDYYTSEEGFIVFTEQYLLRRGYCCENRCRHCPYGFNDKLK